MLLIGATDNGCQGISWTALVDLGLGYDSRHGVTRMANSWPELLKRRLLEVLHMMANTCACWSCTWIIAILYYLCRELNSFGAVSDTIQYDT